MVNVAYPVNTFSITPFLVGTSLILVTAVSALAYFLIGKSEEYKELKVIPVLLEQVRRELLEHKVLRVPERKVLLYRVHKDLHRDCKAYQVFKEY